MKWLLFRIFVTYYLWREVDYLGCTLKECWEYSANFSNYFKTAEWRSLISDAEFSVCEDFSYWTE